MVSANNWKHYGPMVAFICLQIKLPHYQHYADVSENIERPSACQVHSVGCVSKTKSIHLIIFHAINRAVCIQLTRVSFDDCENTCTLSYHHYQIGSMTHLPLLGHMCVTRPQRCDRSSRFTLLLVGNISGPSMNFHIMISALLMEFALILYWTLLEKTHPRNHGWWLSGRSNLGIGRNLNKLQYNILINYNMNAKGS